MMYDGVRGVMMGYGVGGGGVDGGVWRGTFLRVTSVWGRARGKGVKCHTLSQDQGFQNESKTAIYIILLTMGPPQT